MEALIIVVVVAAVAALMLPQQPQSRVIYVPVETAEPVAQNGCLPVLLALVALVALLAFGVITL
jgi:hypothetical protein